ncbi:RNA polymerase subunit sigma-24, partial [Streptomyces sp. MCAF7]
EPVDTAEIRRLLEAFLAAAATGDIDALEELLSADVVAYADGNGMRGVARVAVMGALRVARISTFAKKFIPWDEYRIVEVNGLPALLTAKEGVATALVTITVGTDGIDGFYWILTPEKLRAYERSSQRAVPRRP